MKMPPPVFTLESRELAFKTVKAATKIHPDDAASRTVRSEARELPRVQKRLRQFAALVFVIKSHRSTCATISRVDQVLPSQERSSSGGNGKPLVVRF